VEADAMTARRHPPARDALARQYRDGANLAARQRIYAFDSAGQPWHAWVFEQLCRAVPGDRRARVLEVGCGNARLWQENLERVPQTWEVVLSDASPGMLAGARRSLGSRASRFAWVRLDVQALPLASDHFDAVVANHMLYHVPDRDRAIGEIRRVLVPGGGLLAATNGRGHLRPLKDLLDRYVSTSIADAFTAASGTFVLENGEEQLRTHFRRVDVRRLSGELRVTDTDAIVDYVRSIDRAKDSVVGDALAALRAEVGQVIRDRGSFDLPTEAGVFVATA
jgi:ubiquinone/menaquinone biosynthesis C-methylase UbiE